MTPRRLVPFLVIFLVLAGTYFLLDWHRNKKLRDEEEAKKLFAVKEADITALALQRQSGDIRLVKEGKDWLLTQPLKDQVDKVTMTSLLNTLSQLRFDRDLGSEKDLKPFGLDQPSLAVSFNAGEKSHTLTIGKKSPGGQGYYARRDQEPGVLIIASSGKESLDRSLSDLRNRALFDFAVEGVKTLRVKTANKVMVLEKKDNNWHWSGRVNFQIYPDRLERLLRFVSLARVKEFVTDAPKDLELYGLAPPSLEVTVVTDKGEQRLSLGSRRNELCYAKRGDRASVILMENLLLDLFTAPMEKVVALQKNPQWSHVRGTFPQYLEDRRLWTGEVKDVAALTWGPPGKTWTATKDKDFFQLKGPGNQELRQPAIRLELALLKLRDLEFDQPGVPGKPEAKGKNSLELRDAAGQTLFRLEELNVVNNQVKVRYTVRGASPREALVSRQTYGQWQKEMEQLTTPPSS